MGGFGGGWDGRGNGYLSKEPLCEDRGVGCHAEFAEDSQGGRGGSGICGAEKRRVGRFGGLCRAERDQFGAEVLFFLFIGYKAGIPGLSSNRRSNLSCSRCSDLYHPVLLLWVRNHTDLMTDVHSVGQQDVVLD